MLRRSPCSWLSGLAGWKVPGSLLLFLLVFPGPSPAAVPQLTTYQGQLTDPNGQPLNGTVNLKFTLYTTFLAGEPQQPTAVVVWMETHNSVDVIDGSFSVILGSIVPLSPDVLQGGPFGAPELEVEVNGEPLAPRQPLTATPLAIRAALAEGIPDGSVTATKIGEPCAEGEVLVQGPSGWQCGTAPEGPIGPEGPPGNLLLAGQLCPPGGTVIGFDASGNVLCNNTNPLPNTLTVAVAGSGGGTVRSVIAGIDCGDTCSASYPSGALVVLTAFPTFFSTFSGWSGACAGTGSCTVTMDIARSVTATFNLPANRLEVTSVLGDGRVTSSSGGIDCPGVCETILASGSTVGLTATAALGSAFQAWSGDCAGTAGSICIRSTNSALSVSAAFTNQGVNILKTGPGSGLVTGSGVKIHPSGIRESLGTVISCGGTCTALFTEISGFSYEVTLTATATSGSSVFSEWTGCASPTNICTLDITSIHDVTVRFDQLPPTIEALGDLSFGTVAGSSPAPCTRDSCRGVLVGNVGGGSLSFDATASVSTPPGGTWLSVSPTTGVAPATLTVSVDASGLGAGVFEGSITVSADGATNSPQTLPGLLGVIPNFLAAGRHSVGTSPLSLAIGDLNGDLKLDIVTANQVSDDVSVLLGDGAGSFAAATSIPAGDIPRYLALGDLNGNDRLDLVVTTAALPGNVSVLLGDGAGSFGAATSFATAAIPSRVAIGDFNGDLKPDLAVKTNGGISILLGDGTGLFGAPITTSGADALPGGLAIGDVDGDDALDVVISSRRLGIVFLHLGDGTGALGPGIAVFSGGAGDTVALSDLDLDGDLDLVVGLFPATCTSVTPRGFAILIGAAPGPFAAPRIFHRVNGFRSLAVGDLDGNGIPDLVGENGHCSVGSLALDVVLGDSNGSFAGTILPGSNAPTSPAIGDLNGDGKPDLAVAHSGTNDVSIFLSECVPTTCEPVPGGECGFRLDGCGGSLFCFCLAPEDCHLGLCEFPPL